MLTPRLNKIGAAILAYCCFAAPTPAQAPRHAVAITVDDLPYVSDGPVLHEATEAAKAKRANRMILEAFKRNHIPATGFVIEQSAETLGLSSSTAILRQWTNPGFDLGNHFYSHPDINDLSVDQIEEEIIKGEKTFAPLLHDVGRKPSFLRFPYNHTGDTQAKHDRVAAFLSARGYRLAPCTIENSDYLFNDAYAFAIADRDKEAAARIRAAYLSYTAAEIDWYTALDKQVFGYEPPHIMLLHDNALNAETIEQTITLFKERNYQFVSLSDAEKDPAYAVPETFVTKFGPMWGYRWAQEKHVKVNGRNEPEPPAWIMQDKKHHQATR